MPASLQANPRGRLRRSIVGSAAIVVATCGSLADAQTWRLGYALSWESTLTDNVDLAPSDRRRADWINQVTPTLRITESGARTRLTGSISLPLLIYARTSENNYVAPLVNLNGTAEAIENFLFVDASANVSQEYRTPFGALPGNLSSATNNRFTSQSYSVAPYIRGVFPNNVSYELRNTSNWTDADTTGAGGRGYTNIIDGHVTREPAPFGWSLEYSRSDTDFGDVNVAEFTNFNSQLIEIARARALYRPDPTLELFASAGYENTRLALSEESGATYGVGVEWRPTDRTRANASWEHRFFGPSYQVQFDHRMPLTAWSIRASRDITNYPAQLATLGAGQSTSALLDSIFSSRVPDAGQRQTLVDQIIRERGLPAFLNSPVALFTQQITLVESESATFGILGARNSIFFTAFRAKNEPVPGSELAAVNELLANLNDNTQVGANVVFTHAFASNLTFGANADWSRATSNQEPFQRTTQYGLRALLSSTLSPFTSIYAGARFLSSRSNVDEDYREIAGFVGVNYTFH